MGPSRSQAAGHRDRGTIPRWVRLACSVSPRVDRERPGLQTEKGGRTVIHPTIHLNGTAKCDLIDQWSEVVNACIALQRALSAATPNGRDYYPQGAARFAEALVEHAGRKNAIDALIREMRQLQDRAITLKPYVGSLEEEMDNQEFL
jgi:hypothetical protein